MVTWPSAVSTTLLSLRTHSTVVPCIWSFLWVMDIQQLYSGGSEIEHGASSGLWRPRRKGGGGLVLVVVLVSRLFFGFLFFLAYFFPAFIEGFFGEKLGRHAGVVIEFVEEHLIDFDAVALAGDLERRLDTIDRMVVGVVFDFFAAHAGIGVAGVDDFANG